MFTKETAAAILQFDAAECVALAAVLEAIKAGADDATVYKTARSALIAAREKEARL